MVKKRKPEVQDFSYGAIFDYDGYKKALCEYRDSRLEPWIFSVAIIVIAIGFWVVL